MQQRKATPRRAEKASTIERMPTSGQSIHTTGFSSKDGLSFFILLYYTVERSPALQLLSPVHIYHVPWPLLWRSLLAHHHPSVRAKRTPDAARVNSDAVALRTTQCFTIRLHGKVHLPLMMTIPALEYCHLVVLFFLSRQTKLHVAARPRLLHNLSDIYPYMNTPVPSGLGSHQVVPPSRSRNLHIEYTVDGPGNLHHHVSQSLLTPHSQTIFRIRIKLSHCAALAQNRMRNYPSSCDPFPSATITR